MKLRDTGHDGESEAMSDRAFPALKGGAQLVVVPGRNPRPIVPDRELVMGDLDPPAAPGGVLSGIAEQVLDQA